METVIWKSCDNCADKNTSGTDPICKGGGRTSGCWLADTSVHQEVSRCFDENPTAVGFKIVPVFNKPKDMRTVVARDMHNKLDKQLLNDAPSGVKFDNGKPRTDLVPPEAVLGLADLYRMGAEKYADRNWEKGMNYTRLIGAMERHMLAYKSGENYAPDDKQHHMLSVAWCAFALFTYDCRGMAPEWDDRPDYQACPGAVAEVANLNNREVAHA